MAYTSTSSISSSVWYGPGGSPIISPSQWQTQVVNNLAVLAVHDHSASAGEGASSLNISRTVIAVVRTEHGSILRLYSLVLFLFCFFFCHEMDPFSDVQQVI